MLSKFINTLWSSISFLFLGETVQDIADMLRTLDVVREPARTHFAIVPESPELDLQSERFALSFGIRLIGQPRGSALENAREALLALRDAADDAAEPVQTEGPKYLSSVRLQNIGPFTDLCSSISVDTLRSSASRNVVLPAAILQRASSMGLAKNRCSSRPWAPRLPSRAARA